MSDVAQSQLPPEWPGEKLTLGSNRALVLAQPLAYRLCSGSVAVFAVKLAGQEPDGPRRHLFTCRAGELLFGGCSRTTAETRAFLVVGLTDSELVRIDTETPLQLAALSPDRLHTDIERWVDNVARLVESDERPRVPLPWRNEEPIALPAEQCLVAGSDAHGWLEIEGGACQVRHDEVVLLSAEHSRLPIHPNLWVTAREETRVRRRDLLSLSSFGALAQSLDLLHELCFRYLAELEISEHEYDRHRLQRRFELEQEQTDEVFGRFTEVLQSKRGYQRRSSHLLSALEILGTHLQLEFSPPSKAEEGRRQSHPLEAIARASGVRIRRVQLTGRWWLQDSGPLLGFRGESESPVALIPEGGRYRLLDPATNENVPITTPMVEELRLEAVSFIAPFPAGKITLVDLFKFSLSSIRAEIVLGFCLALGAGFLGMLIAPATQLVIDEAIPGANERLLWELTAGLVLVALLQAVFALNQGWIILRMLLQMTARLQAATVDRLLRLSTRFFRRFASGDLANRAMMVTEISQSMTGSALTGLLTSGIACLNLGVCWYYSPTLALIALGAALITALVTGVTAAAIRTRSLEQERREGELFGLSVQLIEGVTKLRVGGAEQRAFNHWGGEFARQLSLENGIQRLTDANKLFSLVLSSVSMMLLFFFATRFLATGEVVGAVPVLTMGTFLAFHVAFEKLIDGAEDTSNTLVDLMDTWAKKDLIGPLLDEPLESGPGRSDPGRLSGAVAWSDIVFRYRKDGPRILDHVSVHADPGEFIALVGPSGSGKSTLFKLLLGFEIPESGSVQFDRQDLSGLHLQAVRRQIGVVLQGGRINAAPIFENIAGGNHISLEEAWEAARDAGFADDIDEMPMGMHTVINEGASNLSGGQRQRLLIARALVTRPRILLLDEATSALDNRTQQIVSDAVRRRQVTRIVVAHRLSTIRDADRIYALDQGKVVQCGTYNELLRDRQGLFARMVARQIA